jgi:uncharacterized Tic20 family protein
MNNPYKTPAAILAEIGPNHKRPGLAQTLAAIIGFSILSLLLAWLIAPMLAWEINKIISPDGTESLPIILAIDVVVSFSIFLFCSYCAAKLSGRHTLIAAFAVGLIGWLVYFIEVGGIEGITQSEYGLWYELFPTHFLPATISWLLIKRQRKN